MTKREKEILQIIEKFPFISQQELADELNITRSATAVHLSNLMKKGLIQGKGYIINYKPYICVIGGSYIDMMGVTHSKAVLKEDNLGFLEISLGGVGRNIAETLTRLGIRTKLITALGDDFYGKEIIDNCQELDIDINDSLILNNKPTSALIAIQDNNHELVISLAASDINDHIDVNFLKRKREQISKAEILVIDTNLSQSTLEYICDNFKGKIFVDTVTKAKASRASNILEQINYIKSNTQEAEILCGFEIKTEANYRAAADFLHKKGIEKVFITRGKDGVFYSDYATSGFYPALEPDNIVLTIGAGESFCAGAIYGIFNELDILESVKIGSKCAALTIASKYNVSPEINEKQILN